MRARPLAFAALAFVAALAPALGQEPGEGGPFVARPLDVEVVSPANGSAVREANLTAVIEADGESVGSLLDNFTNGTRAGVDLDTGGLSPNASAPPGNSSYTSAVLELPSDARGLEWTPPLDLLTSGSSSNLTLLLGLEVRFGDRTAGRNWSAWVGATLDGEYGDPRGPANETLREWPAFQYRIAFLDPANATNPTVSQVEVWYLAHIVKVEARLGPSGSWTDLGITDGRYNFSVALPLGNSSIEARVTDARGAQKFVVSIVTLDQTPPAVASAPPNGSSIPADEAAVIRFSEPIDTASAAAELKVSADFPVDVVWSADNTTVFLSAQESGKRGPVTVAIGPHLRDRAGNELGEGASYTYQMGRPAETRADITPLLIAVFSLVGVAAVAVLYFSGQAKRRNEAHAEQVRRELDGGGERPPGES